jgi:phytoene/squalene synthetase
MERYQIRLRGKTADELCEEVAEEVWREVAPILSGREVKGHKAVAAALREVFSRSVHHFDVCGTEPFCDEGCGRPLVSDAENTEMPVAQDEEDLERYQLFVPQDLEQFLQETASVVWLHLLRKEAVQGLEPGRAERDRIAQAVRRALGPYVFFNAECGHRRQCVD